MTSLLSTHRADILRIAAAHGASNVRVFGSVARGEHRPDSDIDLLVDFETGRGLLDHVALVQDLSDLLGRRVDVVSGRSLHRFVRDRILSEARAV